MKLAKLQPLVWKCVGPPDVSQFRNMGGSLMSGGLGAVSGGGQTNLVGADVNS
jgi:hypothetical protein